MMSNKQIIGILILICGFLSCKNERPSGKEAEDFLNHVNKVSRPEPKGNSNEFYSLLSKQFLSTFEEEIMMAKEYDSLQVRNLPRMKMLRVLSLKNFFGDRLYRDGSKTLLLNWFQSAGKGFPLRNGDRYYYTPKKSMEEELLRKGSTFPQILIIRETDELKVDPFNTKEFQDLRMNEILKKEKLEDLIKKSAWLSVQDERPINWAPVNSK